MPLSHAASKVAAAAASSTGWNKPPSGPPPKPSSVTSTMLRCRRLVFIQVTLPDPGDGMHTARFRRSTCEARTHIRNRQSPMTVARERADDYRYLSSADTLERTRWALSTNITERRGWCPGSRHRKRVSQDIGNLWGLMFSCVESAAGHYCCCR